MSKRTPGPWMTIVRRDRHIDVCDRDSYRLATVNSLHGKEQSIANAALIAGAPELLEACKALVSAMAHCSASGTGYTIATKTVELAQTAIAKAEGN